MCGICGWILLTQQKSEEVGATDDGRRLEIVNAMTQTLVPRGPDDQNTWISGDGFCVFGHTRLIVVDPEGGKQPMTRLDKHGNSYTINYNGELYNTEDIRKQLIDRGYTFEAYSDTEVLLLAYIEWKSECVDHLQGVFAFAIWSNGELFFARDRIGVKPFFYSVFPDNFIFGSEIKALLEHPLVSRDVPFDALATIFAVALARPMGFVPFRDIQELKPGFAGTFSKTNGLKVWCYWELSGDLTSDSLDEAAVKVHSLLKDACLRRMVCDVPFGALLSGGIDSTATVHFVQQKMERQTEDAQQFKTFSVALPDYTKCFKPTLTRCDNDEEYIRNYCSEYTKNHIWIHETCSEIVSATEVATIAKDYPAFGDIDTTFYLLFNKIKPYATMVLSGEGADETFGGYKHFYLKDFCSTNPLATASNYNSILKNDVADKLNLIDHEIQLYETYASNCPLPTKGELDSTELVFRRRIYFHIKCVLHSLLERKDRLSMASGVEGRIPFTDHRLVDYVFQLPLEYKFKDGVEKFVLRKAMESETDFPEQIRNRPKTPYPATTDERTLQLCRDLLKSVIDSSEPEPIFKWFDHEKIKREFENEFKSFNIKYGDTQINTCLNLYSINFWLKHYKVNVVK